MTDMPYPEPQPIQPDAPEPPLPGEGGGDLPSDVPNTLPGRPDPFTGAVA